MVAAPQYATLTITSPKGITRSIDVYCSDVANGHVRFDQGAGSGATTQEKITCPMSGYISDFSILTGMTDTTALQVIINNAPTGDWLRYNNFLNTAERPNLAIPVVAGQEISMIQRA